MSRADSGPAAEAAARIGGQLFTVGLTGGIGCGKSTAAALFATLGAKVIDADLIAHRLTAPQGAAMAAIRAAFGGAMIDADGALDRQAMRAKVFADASAKMRLESILHPLIRVEIQRELGAAAAAKFAPGAGDRPQPSYGMIVVPLLFETGAFREVLHRSAAVDCAEAAQLRQVMQRSALAADEVRRIMAAQIPRALRLQLADDVLCNSGTVAQLHEAVRALHTRYLNRAGERGGFGALT